jgi:hypothetical protein
MLNLDQTLMLFDIFSQMGVENLPLEISQADKDSMQEEFKKIYMIENEKERNAEMNAIQTKYGSGLIPKIIKFAIANIGKAKEPIREFVASYKGITVQEASKTSLKDIILIVQEIKSEVGEALKSFLSLKSAE